MLAPRRNQQLTVHSADYIIQFPKTRHDPFAAPATAPHLFYFRFCLSSSLTFQSTFSRLCYKFQLSEPIKRSHGLVGY
ncbi:hypothetical protein Hdeb2414_s0023g00629121 [Helianthus debilis subsp. tardiflorus]